MCRRLLVANSRRTKRTQRCTGGAAATAARCTRNRDNRKAIFLASRYVALGRLRDLPILTLRLPFSIAFFCERGSPCASERAVALARTRVHMYTRVRR